MRRATVCVLLAAALASVVWAQQKAAQKAAPKARPKTAGLRVKPTPEQWVAATLKNMTIDEKIGQMLFDRVEGAFQNFESEGFQHYVDKVKKLHMGGFIVYRGTPHDTAALINELQRNAKVPLLIAGDLERGAASQFPNMAVSLPSNLGIAATRDPQTAAFAGLVTAREGRAVGFHWAYAPVVDVNNNPDNPIINIRSFGEDPALVGKMAAAYIKAAEAEGILTTAKHFPGHGDTATDSHIDLGVVAGDCPRLDAIELAPFRAAIEAGTSSIMTAHLAVPAVEPDTRLPATMSHNVLTGLLREQLGFKGLIVTDAVEMGGITTQYWPGEATLRAIDAGADVLLLPPNSELSFRVIRAAVDAGRIKESRLDESVTRILSAKAKLKLHENALVDLNKIGTIFGSPAYQETADKIADRSITLVRDYRSTLPISKTKRQKLMILSVSADAGTTDEYFAALVRQRVEDVQTARVGPDLTAAQATRVLELAAKADVVVAPLYVRISAGKGTAAMPAAQTDLLRKVAALNKPMMAISFSNPYLLRSLPDVPGYLCAWSIADVADRAAVRAIFGEIKIGGKLPVTIPYAEAQGAPLAELGSGIQLPALPMQLVASTADQEKRFPKAFAVLEQAVKDHATPGAVVAIGMHNEIIAHKAFGKMSNAKDAAPMPRDAMFDMASISKVVGTTTAAALLVEQKWLLLDVPVSRYIPEFASDDPARNAITVRQLLMHSSGMVGYDKLFYDAKNKKEIMDKVHVMKLANPPGTKFVYSDFGIMLLAEIIERITGQPLDQLLRLNLFQVIGMTDTMYNPAKSFLPRIPPTEDDKDFRHRLIHGEVHDEHAWVMGGVAGHAGLFSTARDLSVFCQMMLNGGVYAHRRILKRSTVDAWTKRQNEPEGTTRALGWDTAASPTSMFGHNVSSTAFGHTGFTGTSLVIDPEKDLFVVLLSNRVNPTRENQAWPRLRSTIHDAILQDLGLAPAAVTGQ